MSDDAPPPMTPTPYNGPGEWVEPEPSEGPAPPVPVEVGVVQPEQYQRADHARYAVGVPGQHPRMLIDAGYPELAQLQALPAEVVFRADALPPEPYVISDDGLSLRSVDLGLAEMQQRAWTLAKVYRDQKQNGGCVTSFGAIDTDDASRAKLSGAATAALGAMVTGAPFSVVWTRADNTPVELSAPQAFQAALEVFQFFAACQYASNAIRNAIFAPDIDAAELAAVDLAAGYPA